jgi:hypothetical protein
MRILHRNSSRLYEPCLPACRLRLNLTVVASCLTSSSYNIGFHLYVELWTVSPWQQPRNPTWTGDRSLKPGEFGCYSDKQAAVGEQVKLLRLSRPEERKHCPQSYGRKTLGNPEAHVRGACATSSHRRRRQRATDSQPQPQPRLSLLPVTVYCLLKERGTATSPPIPVSAWLTATSTRFDVFFYRNWMYCSAAHVSCDTFEVRRLK